MNWNKILRIVDNHNTRTEEGRQLLEEGRSLSEMKTKPFGLTEEETLERRGERERELTDMPESRLKFAYGNVRFQLERRYGAPNLGTSELELHRIQMEMEFERRGMDIPEVDFDRIRRGERR